MPYLCILSGKRSPLTVYHGTTILQIKELLQPKIAAVSQDQIKVFYQRNELSDDSLTLADYGVDEDATLCLRRCITIRIKSETSKPE